MQDGNKKPTLAKLKLGTSQFQVGRIEYRVPSSVRLSRHSSQKSLDSASSNEAASQATSPIPPKSPYAKADPFPIFGLTQHLKNKSSSDATTSIRQRVTSQSSNEGYDQLSIPEAIPEETSNDSTTTVQNQDVNLERPLSDGFETGQDVQFYLKAE
jgi:hypothetical protein